MLPLSFVRREPAEMQARADDFFADLKSRRSVRDFSSTPIPLDVVRRCIETAGRAPSGANKQPWTFVLVTSPKKKRAIRLAAEEEERKFYEERAPERWLKDLAHLGTDANKPFLEHAPALIAVFAQKAGPSPTDVEKKAEQHYYVSESIGLACGFLIASLHHAGLCTLTHTPSPLAFLSSLLHRPSNERPFLLLPVGYPADDCQVPVIEKKPLRDFLVEF